MLLEAMDGNHKFTIVVTSNNNLQKSIKIYFYVVIKTDLSQHQFLKFLKMPYIYKTMRQ